MPENRKEVDYLYRPVDHLITGFASANGLTLSYVADSPWDGPGYELGWVNPKGHLCRMSLVQGGTAAEVSLSLCSICWGPSDMLGRRWWMVPIGEAVEELCGKLAEAKAWADEL